jgi:hypothetical protein
MLEVLWNIAWGAAGSALVYALISVKVWRLQCDLAAMREQFLKLRNTRAADQRWKVQEELEVLKQAAQMPSEPKKVVNPLAKFGIVK